jgi:ABC-type nitrate/sulfonate/bicarbonate transport system substrate-binding protein/CheY-like chemotaxis protein
MLEKIKLWGVKDPNVSSQLILAEKLGYFKEEGLHVTYRLLQSGTTMPREILRAKIKPFAWTQTVITTLILQEQNLDVKIIAPLANISGTQQVIIQEDRSIRLPRDLEGKRVGMAEGAAIYVAIQNMAKDFSIDLSKVQFVNLLPLQQLDAFKNGDIDAMACWEPWTTRAEEAGGKFYFSGTMSKIPENEGPVNWLVDQSMLMTTPDRIEQDQEILCAIIRAMIKATKFTSENVKDAAHLLTEPLSVGYFEARHMLENNQYSMNMDSMFRLGIFSIRELLYSSNVISSLIDEKELYTPTLLQQVNPKLVNLDTIPQEDIQVTLSHDMYTRQEASIVVQDDTSLTFLVVDDSNVIRTILKEMIVLFNGQVVGEAITGREAIDQYMKVSPDIVIMDLSMPDMTGIDAIKAILQFNPQANIIVLSGSNFPETRQEVFDLGVKMFIPKPFDLKRVTGAIQSLLQY